MSLRISRRAIIVAIGFTLLLGLMITPMLALFSETSMARISVNLMFRNNAEMLRKSSVIEGVNDVSKPTIKASMDCTYDIVYYYLDTYLSDTIEAARYTSRNVACNFWSHNPRHTQIVSHGTYSTTSPYYTPYFCFEYGQNLNPNTLAALVPAGSMYLTDAVFLTTCFSLMNFEADRPASVSFGKTFIQHCEADYAIGSPIQIHALSAILVSTYFWHFKLVYGHSTITAFNLAKAHTILFLGLAAMYWPISIPLAIIWLNQGFGIPLPSLVANLLLFVLFLFSIGAFMAALNAFQMIIVDANYYGSS